MTSVNGAFIITNWTFDNIVRQLGTPAKPPKPRGISPGRRKDMKLPKRLRQKVVVNGKKNA